MRKQLLIKGFLTFLLVLVSLHSAWAQEKQLILRVDGLACPFCAYGLEKKMMNIPGVLSYDADLKKGEVYVGLQEDAKIDVKILTKAVKESGFTLRKVFIKTADGEKELDIENGS